MGDIFNKVTFASFRYIINRDVLTRTKDDAAYQVFSFKT